MSEREFKIGAREFKLMKIDPFKQFHIVRKLGPIMGDIFPFAQKLMKAQKENMSEEETFESIATLAQPIMSGLAKLSDEDATFVLMGLCSAAEMKQMPTGNWAKIVHDKAGLMFQDLELPELLQIAGRAFQFNLTGFFNSSRQTLHGK